jgi:thiol-disulfide isomerase/thioredoxin
VSHETAIDISSTYCNFQPGSFVFNQTPKTMTRLFALLLLTTQTYAQPNVWLSGHLIDGPNEQVTITLPRFGREKDDILLASAKADKNGDFSLDFKVEHGQSVKMNYFGSNFLFYLHPNDSLKITTSQHIFNVTEYTNKSAKKWLRVEISKPPIFEGKAGKLNQFLYKNGLLGRDSLQEKPIIEHVTAQMYATMMDDIADYTWTKYQKQFGLADSTQAVYVQASLAAQSYFRKLRFGSEDSREFGIDFVPFIPSFKIIQNDAARYSESYLYALVSCLKIYYIDSDDSLTKTYNRIAASSRNLPKTQEILLAQVLNIGVFDIQTKNYDQCVARFEKDFPNSVYAYQIKRANWSHRLFEEGTQFPEIVFQNNTNQNTDITKFRGKTTALLFWNTWCDSCQIRLTEFAQLAQSYKDSSINFVAIAANNRLDSWQEFVKSTTYPNVTQLYANSDELNILRGAMSDSNFPTNAHLLLLDSNGKITKRVNLANSTTTIATQIKPKISK